MALLKVGIRDWIPPVALRLIRRVRGSGIRFESKFDTWEDASANCTGYDSQEILEKVLEATLKVKRGEAVFERDSVLFDEIDYSWPTLSGLLWTAAQDGGALNVLDFGGALGSCYYQNIKYLKSIKKLNWSIVEQKKFVDAGNELISEGPLKFYSEIEDCLLEQKPNVILCSSVLQYLRNPFETLEKLSNINAEVMLINRTPVAKIKEKKLLIQKVPSSIYKASYPMWLFSEIELLEHLSKKWKIMSSFDGPEEMIKYKNGINFKFQGYILKSCG